MYPWYLLCSLGIIIHKYPPYWRAYIFTHNRGPTLGLGSGSGYPTRRNPVCEGGVDGSVQEELSVPVGRIGHLIGKASKS